jgi:hypothetical protein
VPKTNKQTNKHLRDQEVGLSDIASSANVKKILKNTKPRRKYPSKCFSSKRKISTIL